MLRCCVTRPRSRQGLSTASPLGTDLGKNVDRPRPRGQGGKRCGAGHGQWRRWGDFGTCRGAVGSVRRKGDDDAARRGALACSSRKWCGGQGVRRRGPKGWCDARGEGKGEGVAPKSHVVLAPHPRGRGPGGSSLPPPTPPTPTAVLASYLMV